MTDGLSRQISSHGDAVLGSLLSLLQCYTWPVPDKRDFGAMVSQFVRVALLIWKHVFYRRNKVCAYQLALFQSQHIFISLAQIYSHKINFLQTNLLSKPYVYISYKALDEGQSNKRVKTDALHTSLSLRTHFVQ